MIAILTTDKRFIHFFKETRRPGDSSSTVEIHPHELELTPQTFDVLDEQARDQATARIADVPLENLELELINPHLQWAINPQTKHAALIIYRTNVLGHAAEDPSYEIEDEDDPMYGLT